MASKIVKGRGLDLIWDLVLGVVGAFLGGWIMSFFGAQGVTGFNLPSLLVAIGGAVALLWVVGLLRGGRRR